MSRTAAEGVADVVRERRPGMTWQVALLCLLLTGGGGAAGARLGPMLGGGDDGEAGRALIEQAVQRAELARAHDRDADRDRLAAELRPLVERLAAVERELAGLAARVEALPGRRR